MNVCALVGHVRDGRPQIWWRHGLPVRQSFACARCAKTIWSLPTDAQMHRLER